LALYPFNPVTGVTQAAQMTIEKEQPRSRPTQVNALVIYPENSPPVGASSSLCRAYFVG